MERMAIEVSAVAAMLDFSEHPKTAKMAFTVLHIVPWAWNWAPFRSTIDGVRDNGNRSFGHGGHLGFFRTSQNGIFGIWFYPLGSKSSSVSLYDRRFPRYRQLKFRASDNRGFLWRTSQNGQNGFWATAYPLGFEIELRFALRSTVSEISALEVSGEW